ncbi:MAG: hypothetical protein WD267_01705 [Balneolales bacterium]
MKISSARLLTIFFTIVPLILISCSDDPAGNEDRGEAPTPPSFSDIKMDLSIFENEPSQQTAETDNHNQAGIIAMVVQAQMTALSSLPQVYFNPETWGESNYDNGDYTWNYDYSWGGESMSINVTVDDLPDGGHDWQLRYSLSTSEENIDNALFIRAVVSEDEKEGYWEIHDIEGSGDVYRLDFRLNDDEMADYVSIKPSGASNQEEIAYELDGSQASLIMRDDDGEITTRMGWNNDTGTGFIQSDGYNDGMISCWDEDYMDSGCEVSVESH